jgi:hypothetical protein
MNAPHRGRGAAAHWAAFPAAPASHGYITKKDGRPDGLRVVPEGYPLRVNGESMSGCLVVPVLPLGGGEPVSLVFIPPPEVAARWKEKKKPPKLNLKGAPMDGVFIVGELVAGAAAYLCEGIGQAWACWKATGQAAVCCFGWGRVRAVAGELRQRDASARLVLVPDKGKEAEAETIAREVRGEFVTMPSDTPPNFDANDYAAAHGHDALEALLGGAGEPAPPPMPFALVPVADLETEEPPAPAFVWEGLVPAEAVTLLTAHGGTGKSFVMLMLCVAVALGLPLFGLGTRRGKAAFFSGEDGAAVLRHRLRWLCRRMGVSVRDLEGRLFIIDATDHDPRLYVEAAGRRDGDLTPTFASLREFVQREGIGLLVLDNSSDTFDASEIDRARVRAFMRALSVLAREAKAGVLLLAHVDKGTSRGDRGPNTEGYSGSTAWHNSARSRLFMRRDAEGALVLEHQKGTHSAGLTKPLRLAWVKDDIPVLDEPLSPMLQGMTDRADTKALLKLVHEFTERGEWVATGTTSRNHAAKLLRHERTYPKLKDGEVFDLLRKAERAGQLQRVSYRGADRHQRERWQVTREGRDFAGIAGTAATAGTA